MDGRLDVLISGPIVDLNGNCLSDLVVVSYDPSKKVSQIEMWINDKSNSYKLHSAHPLPQGVLTGTIVDIDGDGNVDIVYALCDLSTPTACRDRNELHIF